MSVTAVTQEMLIAKGIPEAFLVALGIHILTETRVEWKKYVLMSLLFIGIPYVLRQLPISLGVNTVISLFALIFIFQLLYKPGMKKIIQTMISPLIIMILISIAEMLNMLLLSIQFGQEQASVVFMTPNGWTQCMYTWPSTVILALLLAATYFIMRVIKKKRKNKDGTNRKETGE